MKDFLNTLIPNGLSLQGLLLKQDCLILLLRYLDPSKILCNGTHLTYCGFDSDLIDAKIYVGDHTRKNIFIIKILFLPDSNKTIDFPFKWKTQFSIRLSFVMTINKSKRQTLDVFRIYLPELLFSHRQSYVTL